MSLVEEWKKTDSYMLDMEGMQNFGKFESQQNFYTFKQKPDRKVEKKQNFWNSTGRTSELKVC